MFSEIIGYILLIIVDLCFVLGLVYLFIENHKLNKALEQLKETSDGYAHHINRLYDKINQGR